MIPVNIDEIVPDKYYIYYYLNAEDHGKVMRLFKCIAEPLLGWNGKTFDIIVKEYYDINVRQESNHHRGLDYENDWDGDSYAFDTEEPLYFWELTDLEVITHICLEDI